jgi:hypothetical protein
MVACFYHLNRRYIDVSRLRYKHVCHVILMNAHKCWSHDSSQSDEWYHQHKQQESRIVYGAQLGQIKCIVNCTE